MHREVAEYMREQEGRGATCVALAVAHCLVGTFSIKDPLKPEAVGVVAALHSMGIQCHMITGDNWMTARTVAAQLGIINVLAEVLPAGKAEKVRKSLVPCSSPEVPVITPHLSCLQNCVCCILFLVLAASSQMLEQ